jgi:hypothetical protein
MKHLMKNLKISYDDLHKYEEITEKRGIWSGKVTNDFLKWLDLKNQKKITDYL